MHTRTKMYIYDRRSKSTNFEEYTQCPSDPFNYLRFMYKGSNEILLETPEGFHPSGIYSTRNEGRFFVLFQGPTIYPLLYTGWSHRGIHRLKVDSVTYSESVDKDTHKYFTQLNLLNNKGGKQNIWIEGKLVNDITPKSIVESVVLTEGKRKLTLNNLL